MPFWRAAHSPETPPSELVERWGVLKGGITSFQPHILQCPETPGKVVTKAAGIRGETWRNTPMLLPMEAIQGKLTGTREFLLIRGWAAEEVTQPCNPWP